MQNETVINYLQKHYKVVPMLSEGWTNLSRESPWTIIKLTKLIHWRYIVGMPKQINSPVIAQNRNWRDAYIRGSSSSQILGTAGGGVIKLHILSSQMVAYALQQWLFAIFRKKCCCVQAANTITCLRFVQRDKNWTQWERWLDLKRSNQFQSFLMYFFILKLKMSLQMVQFPGNTALKFPDFFILPILASVNNHLNIYFKQWRILTINYTDNKNEAKINCNIYYLWGCGWLLGEIIPIYAMVWQNIILATWRRVFHAMHVYTPRPRTCIYLRGKDLWHV